MIYKSKIFKLLPLTSICSTNQVEGIWILCLVKWKWLVTDLTMG